MINTLKSLPKNVKSIWNRSIRRQLVLSFGLVALVLVVSFSYLMFVHQRNFLYKAATDRATALAHTLASSSASWVLADDLAGLQEVLTGFADTPDIKFAQILSLRGEVLGSTDVRQIGKYVTDDVSLALLNSSPDRHELINQPSMVDVALPVLAGGRHIGWARVEMTRDSSNSNLRLIASAGMGFTLLAVIAALLVSIMLARRLTRGLYHLMKVSSSIESGKRDVRAVSNRHDELGELAKGFNRMLDALNDTEQRLERINRIYAAWTQCSETIVREKDEQQLLTSICQILANRVPFELVWIGTADENGWVSPVAMSHEDAEYLRGIKVSSDPARKEGHGPLGMAIHSGVPSLSNDFLNDPKSILWRPLATKLHYHSVAAFPIFRGDRCFGGISVYSCEVAYFSPELISLLGGLADDITFALNNLDRERQRQADVVYLEQAAKVFENSKEGIVVTDADNNIISVNRSFSGITGYLPEEVIGKNPRVLASSRQDEEFYRLMWESIAKTGSWQGELWNRRKNGEVYPESLTITCVKDESGAIVNYIAIFGDISERKRAEERIQQLAHYDVLTGLPNRLLFNDRLEQAIIHAQRSQTRVSLLFLDLDRFKQINDTLGHGVGDQLLQLVGQRLLDCVREQDTVSRLGGDEFIIILPEADEDGAELVAEKMLLTIARPYSVEGHDLRITSSIGIASYPDHANDAGTLVKYADVAMYKAKEGGRNHYQLFNSSMNVAAYERLTLETDLRSALERKQFQLYFQPQVNLVDSRIIGCEALLRWHHPEQGMIPPSGFVPLAEETGLIIQISDWVLEEAIRQASVWRHNGLPDAVVAVNLSALQFRQRDLFEQVKGLLKKYNLPPQALELELTESILMQGVERTMTMLHELTLMGVVISIDDFGTGYSSLSYLKRFPIQKLKIDQSFISDMVSDGNDATMVRTIILMAHSLKLLVIAEGVENSEQVQFLLEAGCDRAQGYKYGRPMPAEQFAELIKKQGKSAGKAAQSLLH